jgi:hypothetical protein
MVEGYRAVDEEAGFDLRVQDIFPKVEALAKKAAQDWMDGLRVVDPPRLRRMRLHLVAVCELNRESWKYATHCPEVRTSGRSGAGAAVASVVSVRASSIALLIAPSRLECR